jgi:hypothetical protein
MGFLFAWSREGKWLTDAAFNLTPVFSEAIKEAVWQSHNRPLQIGLGVGR